MEGAERRQMPQCMEHSGIAKQLEIIERDTKSNCKKLDAIKMWIVTLLGGMVVSLILQIVAKF